MHRTLVLLVLLVLLAATAAADDWRFPRGNLANTGVVKNKGPVKPPKVVWKREVAGSIGTGAALFEGRLYFGIGEFLFASHRAVDGTMYWEKKVKQQVVAWPLIEGAFCYVGGQDGVHYRLQLRDKGEPKTVYAQNAILAPSAVIGDYLSAGAQDGKFYAIQALTGDLLWSREIGEIRHAAAVDKKHAYVVTEDGVLHAYLIKGGKELWKYDGKAGARAAPILAKGVVHLFTVTHLHTLSTKDGAVVATLETKGISSAPVLAKTLLHYGTETGEIVTVDLKKKKEIRRAKVAEEAVSTPLVLGRKVLYGAAGATLFAVTAKDGKVLWTHKGDAPWAPPMVANKFLYAGCGTFFYCLK